MHDVITSYKFFHGFLPSFIFRIVATLQQILPFGSVVVIAHCMLKLIVDSANGRSEAIRMWFYCVCCCSHWTCDWRQSHLIASNSDLNNVYGLASCVRLREQSWFGSWFSLSRRNVRSQNALIHYDRLSLSLPVYGGASAGARQAIKYSKLYRIHEVNDCCLLLWPAFGQTGFRSQWKIAFTNMVITCCV